MNKDLTSQRATTRPNMPVITKTGPWRDHEAPGCPVICQSLSMPLNQGSLANPNGGILQQKPPDSFVYDTPKLCRGICAYGFIGIWNLCASRVIAVSLLRTRRRYSFVSVSALCGSCSTLVTTQFVRPIGDSITDFRIRFSHRHGLLRVIRASWPIRLLVEVSLYMAMPLNDVEPHLLFHLGHILPTWISTTLPQASQRHDATGRYDMHPSNRLSSRVIRGDLIRSDCAQISHISADYIGDCRHACYIRMIRAPSRK